MKKYLILLISPLTLIHIVFAQTEKKDSTLQISGSADIYYKFDFAGSHNSQTPENVVLGTKQNSIDFGMLDIKLKKQLGDASIFSEIAFGARPYFNLVDPQLAYNIQNLYLSYKLSKDVSFSGGLMYRYQTYEKMTPTDNFHYSMSFSFLNQYFNRSAGIRANIQLTKHTKIVAGFYNSYDPKSASNPVVAIPSLGVSDFCTQIFAQPIPQIQASFTLWKEGQKENGLHRNFQAKYELGKKISLGLDVTKYTCTDSITANHSYQSAVGYAQVHLSKVASLGARYEYLERVESPNSIDADWSHGYFSIFTLTSSIRKGPLTFKQEIKFDNTNPNNLKSFYLNKDNQMTTQAKQVVVSAIYTF